MNLEDIKMGQTLVKILSITKESVKSVAIENHAGTIYMRGKVRKLHNNIIGG